VTVIEREPQLGGLAAGFRVGPSALEKFYHHIFKTDTTIIRLIEEVGLGDRLTWAQPNTSVLDRGRICSLGSPVDLLRLRLLSPVERVRFIAGMAMLKAIPNERVFAGRTAARWMPRLMGRHVYEVMFESLLVGKFGRRADEIAMSWLWSRVHERSFRLGYIRGGFQLLYDRLGERVRALVVIGGALRWRAESAPVFAERVRLARAGRMDEIAAIVAQTGLSERCRAENPALHGLMLELIASNDPAAYAEWAAATAPAEMIDPGRVPCPTLVSCGEFDPVAPPSFAEAIAGAIPDARTAVIEGAAHWCQLEAPATVSDAILGFLGEIET
jgi:hypothetical protein